MWMCCEVGSRVPARPTMDAWVGEYEGIYGDYLAGLARAGFPLSQKTSDLASAQAKSRLHERGALLRNGGASVSTGFLSSACVACSGSRCSKTLSISLKCHRSCYYCLTANPSDYAEFVAACYDWRAQLREARESGAPPRKGSYT